MGRLRFSHVRAWLPLLGLSAFVLTYSAYFLRSSGTAGRDTSIQRNDTQPGPAQNKTALRKPAGESEEVEKFRKHLQWIHGLVQKSYAHVLAPWKLNQNVSVSVQEDAFGNALLRVRSMPKLDKSQRGSKGAGLL